MIVYLWQTFCAMLPGYFVDPIEYLINLRLYQKSAILVNSNRTLSSENVHS
jgi:hypothetical protein